jgi:hypothetical protein
MKSVKVSWVNYVLNSRSSCNSWGFSEEKLRNVQNKRTSCRWLRIHPIPYSQRGIRSAGNYYKTSCHGNARVLCTNQIFHLPSDVRTVVKSNDSSAEDLTVDWINRAVYWTDAQSDRIEMSYLNSSLRKVIISSSLDEPRAIAVDPKER